MPGDVRQPLVDAGCADEAAVVEDDHGDDFESATVVGLGEIVGGSLDGQDDRDAFVIRAWAGEEYLTELPYRFFVYLGDKTSPLITIYDSSGLEVARSVDESETEVVWRAEATGDYYVVLGDGTSQGDYTVTTAPVLPPSAVPPTPPPGVVPTAAPPSPVSPDDHADWFDGATAIAVGEAVAGGVNYEGDVDVFAIQADEGVIYQIDVEIGSLEDSWVAVYDSDEWELAYNDDYGDSLASRIVWAAPSSGEFYVELGGFGAGSYTLTVVVSDIVDDHANSIDSATPVTVGQAAPGNLDYQDDEDYFVFEAVEGVSYQVDVELGTLEDSWLAVYDSDEWELAYSDDRADSLASRIVWTAPSSGEYYVEVGGYGAGSFALTVAISDIVDDHGNDTHGATAIQVGQSAAGNLDYEDDVDLFSFTAQAGQLYQIDVALGSLDDSFVALLDADGWTQTENDDYGESQDSRIVWAAEESGDVYIEVGAAWGSDTGVGSYTVTLALSDIMDDHGNDTHGATAIQVGQSAPGNLDYADDIDLFSFTAQAGQLYQIDVALGSLEDSYVALLDADGWTETENDDYGDSQASRIVWAAEESGDVYVEVGAAWGSDTGVGSYTLTLALSDIMDDHGNDTHGATAVSVGSAVTGGLDYDGDRDFFVFEAQEGTIYRIDVALGTLDDSYVALLDADGWELEYNDDFGDSPASLVVWAAPESRDMYVEVGAAWGSGTGVGSYTLTITAQ